MASTLSRIRESALPRLVDHAAGTPLLWILGAMRRKRRLPANPRRFGIMAFETLGDTLLAGCLLASLRASIPGAEVVVFASDGNRAVAGLWAGVDRIVEVPLTSPRRAIAAVRSVPVDVMIDIGQWPRWYALLCAMSRSHHTIGFATPGQTRHYAFDSAVPHRRDVHEIENFQRLLAPIAGVRAEPPQQALKPVGRPPPLVAHERYVVLHPWASGFRFACREWPMERWTELVRVVCGLGLAVLISGSREDQPRTAALVQSCPRGLPVTSIAGVVSLAELAAILQGAAAVVAVNTGVMHLAALLDVPLVALHGPTSRRRWGPVGARSIALAPAGSSCEFLNLGFEYPPGPVDCMHRIAVGEVVAALRTLLGER